MSSKRHRLVGKLLSEIGFTKGMRREEEVRVSTLVPSFPDNRKRIDWFVKDLKLVTEVHGEQHYKPVAFGNRPNAKGEFAKQVAHDIAKQAALENAGYLFLEIPYWDKITIDYLRGAILDCVEHVQISAAPDLHDEPVKASKLRSRPLPSRDEPTYTKSNWGKARPMQSRGFQKKPSEITTPLAEWEQALLDLQENNDAD